MSVYETRTGTIRRCGSELLLSSEINWMAPGLKSKTKEEQNLQWGGMNQPSIASSIKEY